MSAKDRKKLKKLKATAINDSDEEEEDGNAFKLQVLVIFNRFHFWTLSDDEDKIREELQDLIDDNPIEDEESGSESGDEASGVKRKRDDDDDELDDNLSEEDFDLLEENLGIKVKVSELVSRVHWSEC